MTNATKPTTTEAVARALYDAAVAAAHPSRCLAAHLPAIPANGRLIVICVGKAAAAMAVAAEAHYQARGALDRVIGLATAPKGYAATLDVHQPHVIRLMEASHPVPDQTSVAAADAVLELVHGASEQDHVLVLLSGGASALWAAPVGGMDIAAKRDLTRGLLKSGADIHEMNAVRRHLSRIKGGGLRVAARRAPMTTLAISDVPGDDPETIGSGPTVADPTTLADARAVLARRRGAMADLGLAVPAIVDRCLEEPANETPKPGDAVFAPDHYKIVATPAQSLEAAAAQAREWGYRVVNLGDRITGEARVVAADHARRAREAVAAATGPVAILSGGELEVTVRNRSGRGGRSQEYALALAIALDGQAGIAALAGDTDGIDGGDGLLTDPAGAHVDGETLGRARARHLDAQKYLDNNDATSFFEQAGGLLVTGPSHTNVNDFRVLLIEG